MIYELRTYQVQAGKAPEFLKIYEANGLGIITKYAKLIGTWNKESGVINSIVFLWSYESFGHRSEQRAKLGADKEWQAFVPTILPFLVHQESIFLNPASFSPLK
jgi:NIPSNAP